jgi:hypothetical protein
VNREATLFFLVGLAAFGWDAFEDKPQAAYVLQAVLTMVCLLFLSSTAGRIMAMICTAGAGLQLAAIGCAIWYQTLTSKEIGVCDEGTGRPIRAMLGIAVLFVAAQLLRGRNDKR